MTFFRSENSNTESCTLDTSSPLPCQEHSARFAKEAKHVDNVKLNF